ncbi:MAG: hypothetical protein HC930_01280 [Hydrococcus sp. SU_1_0]|nr:hypothetical protein [Hydrococcus sp. SU_1_0]NJR48126.1 hypothetical protein [Hyellaceae cyanobacterium CSU_1_1]
MPALTFNDIFGNYSQSDTDPNAQYFLQLQKDSFYKLSDMGNLPDDVGMSAGWVPTPAKTFYGILMLLKQAQAPKINDDPEQAIYVSDATKNLATGDRDGQIKYTFTISFFVNSGFGTVPSLYDIDQ